MRTTARLLALCLPLAVVACGDDATSGGSPSCAGLAVAVPDHPFYDDPILHPDPARLNGLAREACGRAGAASDIDRFLFGEAPGAIFDALLSRGGAGVPADLRSDLWVLYLSGYFGGVWLRGEIVAAQPNSILAGFGTVPDRETFLETIDEARPAFGAADAAPAAAVAYARGARDFLVDNFGYNKGYLLQILEDPPQGLASPPDLLRCFGPLDCRYDPLSLAALLDYAHVPALVADPPDARWAAVADGMAAIQDAAEQRGRGVWSAGLSVQGFSQEAYDTLLDVSAAFLQAVQATTLANVEAAAEEDGPLARRAAAADAGFRVWVGAYTMGLLDPRTDRELPVYE